MVSTQLLGFNPAKLKRTAKTKELIKEGEIFPWQKRIRQRITACMSIGSTNEIFQMKSFRRWKIRLTSIHQPGFQASLLQVRSPLLKL